LLLTNGLFRQQMPFIFVPGGLTNVQVIFQYHLGRLWVGGESDVARFDGARFIRCGSLGCRLGLALGPLQRTARARFGLALTWAYSGFRMAR